MSQSAKSLVPAPAGSQNERLMLNVGIKAGLGLAASGLVSMLAFRGAGARLFMTGLGMGSGLGYAWCQNDLFLKDSSAVALPLSVQQEFDRYWARAGDLVPNFAKFK